MGGFKNIIRIAVIACLVCGLSAGVCYAQVANGTVSNVFDVQTLSASSSPAASSEAEAAEEGDGGAAADATEDAVEKANAILEEDAASIDEGFSAESAMAESSLAGVAGLSALSAESDEDPVFSEMALTEGSYKYLSEYTPIVNQIGWSTRKDDVNYDGNQISLIVNGTRTYFYKGVSMHASATVVYDLGEGNEYDTFDTYMGVDASRGTNGWAQITFYVSSDNENWTQVSQSTAGNGTTEATHVGAYALNGARYLKFVCDPLGANSADHTCLGGAVLYKGSYNPSQEAPVIDTVENLTAKLEGKSNADIVATRGDGGDSLYMTMLRRSLVEKAGYDNLAHSFFDCSQREQRVAMMTWLWNDEQALEDFVTGGTPNSGGYVKSLAVLAKLYAAHSADLSDKTALFVDANGGTHDGPAANRGELYRIVMIAIALTHDNGPYMWQASGCASDPLERYENYKIAYEDNILRNDVYENLTVEEMRWVMGGRIWNDEIYWLNRYAYNARPTAGYPLVYSPHYFIAYGKDWNYDQKGYFDPANYAQYEAKYGLSSYPIKVTAPSLSTKLSKCWMALEGSQICWGISYLGTTFANSYGVPSKYVRQAGHAAFFVYNRDSQGRAIWGIDNNISGWTGTWVNEDTVGNGNARMMCDWGTRGTSNVSSMNASYITLCTTAQDNLDAYERAEALISMVSSCTTNAEKVALYNDVLKILPYHWEAWRGLVDIYKSDSSYTASDMAALAKRIADEMWYFPLPMHDLVNQLYTAAKAKGSDAAVVEAVALIAQYESQALNKGSNAKTNGASDVIAQTDICVTMANYLKGSLNTALATFSFDGDNAGKVVFGSAYEGVRYRVSVDGGSTWTASGENVTSAGNMAYALTEEQLAKINADNDILIWLEGWPGGGDKSQDPIAENAFRIDILPGSTLDSSTEPNDNEDRFMSVQANAEYSLASTDDPTQPSGEWKDLTTSVSFAGYAGKVFVRIKAHGCYMAGTCDTSKNFYTFTTSNDEEHVYVPISRLTYDSCSSEETSRASDQAAHVADGTLSTRWHTLWDGSDKEKWVTIKLDEPTYISQVNYTPVSGGGNGTMYGCTVYVSSDNLTWVKAGAGSGWGNNDSVKQVVFDHSVYGQYVKIQATSTVGNYASARRFDIFEDQKIKSRKMTGFRVTTPAKTDYVEGEKLDLSGMQVFFTYADGGDEVEMPYTHLSASEEYLYGTGDHTIYLSCGSFEPKSITVTVSERPATATALAVDAAAAKLSYYVGDELDCEGLKVTATYENGAVALLTRDDYSVQADLSTSGQKDVTVSYGGKSATYQITVKEAPVSLKLVSKPTKDTYTLGELLETEGLTVNAVYEGGSEQELAATDYTLIGAEEFGETAGDVTLRVALVGRQSVYVDFVLTVYPYFTREGISYSLSTFSNPETGKDELAIFVTGFCPDCGFIRIPESIAIGTHTYPVRGVEGGAMTNVTGVSEIALPASIMKIESGAFTGSETVKNIYFTEHESFENLDAAKDAFDSDTNLVLYAGSETLTKELQDKDFAKEMAVKDVSDDVVALELAGSYPTTFTRGDAFTSKGLRVMGVLKDAQGNPTGNKIALASSAYELSGLTEGQVLAEVGEKTVTVTFKKATAIQASYTVTVKQVTLHITKNPVSAVYYRASQTIAPLTVEAQSGGTGDELLYQWYRVKSGDESADVAIAGATSASYTPSTSGGYYAIVSVQGQEGLTAQSMTADVGIGDYTAIVGDKGYDDLNTAVANAAGKTVQLLKDVTITSGITVSHSFTLDGKDPDKSETHVITRGTGFTGAFVTVDGSATVTLSNVVLDGGAIWEKDKSKAKWYYDVIERDTNNTGISAQAPLLAVESTAKLCLNEGTVLQNNANAYSGGAPGTNTAGAIRANDSAAISMVGAQILDCYSYWFGSAVYFRDHTSLTISGNSKIHGCSGTDAKSTSAICADNYSTLTINGGEFCHNMGYYKGALIWAGSGAVNINGGNIHDNGFFKSAGGMGTMLYLSGTAKVSVKDYAALQDIYLSSGSQVITVTGDLSGNTALKVTCATAGTACVTASSPELLASAAGVTTINDAEVVVKDGKLAPSESGTTVVATIERAGKTAKFVDLADALAAAQYGETITLSADAALQSAVIVGCTLRIATKGHAITGADDKLLAATGYTKTTTGSGESECIEFLRMLTVIFDVNGRGTAPVAQTVVDGACASRPDDPSATSWVFGGWYRDAACTSSPYDFATPVSESMTLYAKWTEKFTVTFDENGHGTAPAAQTVVDGACASKPADPTADGWVFGGWYESEGCSGSPYDFATPVTGSITLYAKWTEKFTVAFDANGHGTAPVAQTVVEGACASKPADPTADGWVFGGWYRDAACTGTAYDFATPVSENMTLYAKWTEKPAPVTPTPTPTPAQKFTVTFDANGHGTAPAAQTVEDSACASKPADPAATGWTFGGWYADADCTRAWDFATPVSASMTLYAKWTLAPSADGPAAQVAGAGRYDTAAKIATTAYPDGAAGVVVATGANFPDALGASSLAGLLNWPVVLTEPSGLSQAAKDAISKLGARDAVIIGGTAAVSSEAEAQLGSCVSGTVSRVAGTDRYDTSRKIYLKGIELKGAAAWGDDCIVATGKNYPDALSVSGYAFARKAPIFLTDPEAGLADATKSLVADGGFSRALVVGGTAAVTAGDESWLAGTCGTAKRLSGTDRYATSKDIAEFVIASGGTAQGACIATGRNFPDALAGSALAGVGGSVMLLADPADTSTLAVLSANRGAISQIYFLGGDAVVPQTVRDAAKAAAQL